jgi:ADP-ribose pyrophosphatase YjhB (NUDIX family)
MTYNNPTSVAVAAIQTADGRVRYLPTFVRRSESLESAARRVAAGIDIDVSSWSLVRSRTVNNIAYTLCVPTGQGAPGGEDFLVYAFSNLTEKPTDGPTPVAVALVPMAGGQTATLLGVIRNIPPGLGGTALPGGYVDEGETFEFAAAREAREECGLLTRPDEWRIVCSRATAENRLLVFCEHKASPRVGPNGEREVRGMVPFDAREVAALTVIGPETPIVFPTHQEVARQFLARPAV